MDFKINTRRYDFANNNYFMYLALDELTITYSLCMRVLPWLSSVYWDKIKTLTYLTIIPFALVGYEVVNSQRGAKRRVGYNHSYPTRANGIIVLLNSS